MDMMTEWSFRVALGPGPETYVADAVDVMGELLGVPREDLQRVEQWARAFATVDDRARRGAVRSPGCAS